MLTILLSAATVSTPILPNGPWNVQAEEDMCVLARAYGTGTDAITIGFQPLFNESSMDFVMVLDGKKGQQDTGTATIQRAPDGKRLEGSFVGLGTLTGNKYLLRISTNRSLFDELDQTTALKVKAGRIERYVAITAFAKAKPVFENCERALLRSWGVDPKALEEGRGAKPKNDILRYFTPSSYPAAARNNGYIGRSTVVLNIDALGQVTKCRVVAGAGKLLNDATCANATRIPFEPGRSATGVAEPSIYVLRVSWQLPS